MKTKILIYIINNVSYIPIKKLSKLNNINILTKPNISYI